MAHFWYFQIHLCRAFNVKAIFGIKTSWIYSTLFTRVTPPHTAGKNRNIMFMNAKYVNNRMSDKSNFGPKYCSDKSMFGAFNKSVSQSVRSRIETGGVFIFVTFILIIIKSIERSIKPVDNFRISISLHLNKCTQ